MIDKKYAIQILRTMEYDFDSERVALNMAIKSLEEERPKGKWETIEACIDYLDDAKIHECSICGCKILYMQFENAKYKYCPYCGADMRGSEVEE